MNEKEIIKRFLQQISPDIETIDGGCIDCISSFCDGVNSVLVEYGLELKQSDTYPIKIEIIE